MIQLRQGDILLVSVHELPPGASLALPVERGGRCFHVIAEGEATGHAHTLVADACVGFYHGAGPEPELTTAYLAVRGSGVLHGDVPCRWAPA
jgi:hypothetical protein